MVSRKHFCNFNSPKSMQSIFTRVSSLPPISLRSIAESFFCGIYNILGSRVSHSKHNFIWIWQVFSFSTHNKGLSLCHGCWTLHCKGNVTSASCGLNTEFSFLWEELISSPFPWPLLERLVTIGLETLLAPLSTSPYLPYFIELTYSIEYSL